MKLDPILRKQAPIILPALALIPYQDQMAEYF